MSFSCGIDFGTSNSAMGVLNAENCAMVPVEGDHTTLPTVLFFDAEVGSVLFGRAAISRYVDGGEGRFMRSLKSILGSSLAEESTVANGRRTAFLEIISLFLGRLRESFYEKTGAYPDQVVLGRPVHFVDEDPVADNLAQEQLRKAAALAGFRHVTFLPEPVAAALSFEQELSREETILIADIGGGTSDFSLIQARKGKGGLFQNEVLATGGVHVGGNDFDRSLCLAEVMPSFGYGSRTKAKGLEMPRNLFYDLSTWHKVHFLYTSSFLHRLRQLHYDAEKPELLERFIHVIEYRLGHDISFEVEKAKIALSSSETASVDLGFCESGLHLNVKRAAFEKVCSGLASLIREAAQNTLKSANLSADQIDRIVFTGGGAQIPLVRQALCSLFPDAALRDADTFQAVAQGLTLAASRL